MNQMRMWSSWDFWQWGKKESECLLNEWTLCRWEWWRKQADSTILISGTCTRWYRVIYYNYIYLSMSREVANHLKRSEFYVVVWNVGCFLLHRHAHNHQGRYLLWSFHIASFESRNCRLLVLFLRWFKYYLWFPTRLKYRKSFLHLIT